MEIMLAELIAEPIFAKSVATGDTNSGAAITYDTVSYTHLDVYKRQDG